MRISAKLEAVGRGLMELESENLCLKEIFIRTKITEIKTPEK